MIPSKPNHQPGPRAFPYRIDGDKLAADLATLIGDYYIEAARWPRTQSESIRLAADALWYVRDRLITDRIPAADAEVWLEQGCAYLDDLIRSRSARNHPAGKGRR